MTRRKSGVLGSTGQCRKSESSHNEPSRNETLLCVFMYVGMYACMYVGMYACMYVGTYVCM